MTDKLEKVGETALGGGSMTLPENIDGLLKTLDAFLKSGQFPNQPNVHAALVSMETGKELGVPPMWALQTIYPIKGKMTMESKTMLALFHAHGGKSKWGEISDTKAALTLSLAGREPETFTYTVEDAQKSGLLAKGGAWNTVRKAMLQARVISSGIRAYSPGTVMGMYSREEIEDGEAGPAPLSVETMPKVETKPYEAPKNGGRPEPEAKPEAKKEEPRPAPADPVKDEEIIDVEPEPAEAKPEGPALMGKEARSIFLGLLYKMEE